MTYEFEQNSDRTGLEVQTICRALADNLFYIQGKYYEIATKYDFYMALAYTVRDRLLLRWLNTMRNHRRTDVRVVCYLSAEFLLGRHLKNNLINLGIENQVQQALEEYGLDLDTVAEQEPEPGLGNGGLGRLAACYLDSLSTLEIPAIGYGIRYEFGIFNQDMNQGWQSESTDKWLQWGNPWEIVRPEAAVQVNLGGHTETYTDAQGNYRVRWVPEQVIKGIPYDTPILGYRVNTANTLRLWKAEAPESFDFQAFNVGDYYRAVNQKIISETITKVLYPNDEPIQGKQLRLEQQYFFVSCSVQDMIRLHLLSGQKIETFHHKFAIQLNDTHPAIGVVELMRLLIDEHCLDWDIAWNITQQSFGYTNHTLLPEALEKWSLSLFGRLLPRHLELIYEINRRFLNHVRLKFMGNGRLAQLSLIDETGDRYVRMAHIACLGSHAINGVAHLHSELLKTTVFKDFYELFPEKFSNKTNGITPRRWLLLSNPRLTELITAKIGEQWVPSLETLRQLESYVDDSEFRHEFWQIKHHAKKDLARYISDQLSVHVDPQSMFDIQVKRIHEYKRQHLNILHVITLYRKIKQNLISGIHPRTVIFGGKAAPGYWMAKLIIKLINAVSQIVNQDPDVRDCLKVVFLPNYSVTLGQRVYPAADLSEQISLAGLEASGTGNMKFSMNGALTIGTLDGANIEIRDEVGHENFFLFGMKAEEVSALKTSGYRPWDYYQSNEDLQATLDLIGSGYFSNGDTGLFRPLLDSLLHHDPYMVLADYQSYAECQEKVNLAYQDREVWTKMAILNTARMGKFSSDRAIREYCRDIWQVEPVQVEIKPYTLVTAAFSKP